MLAGSIKRLSEANIVREKDILFYFRISACYWFKYWTLLYVFFYFVYRVLETNLKQFYTVHGIGDSLPGYFFIFWQVSSVAWQINYCQAIVLNLIVHLKNIITVISKFQYTLNYPAD